MAQYIIAGLIVTAAAAYLVYSIAKRAKRGGCDCSSHDSHCTKCEGCSMSKNCKLKKREQ